MLLKKVTIIVSLLNSLKEQCNLFKSFWGRKGRLAVLQCCLFLLCGVALMLNCTVFLILNLWYSVKLNNSMTLCGVVVYHLAVVTKMRNQANEPKWPKQSTTTQNDKKWSKLIDKWSVTSQNKFCPPRNIG